MVEKNGESTPRISGLQKNISGWGGRGRVGPKGSQPKIGLVLKLGRPQKIAEGLRFALQATQAVSSKDEPPRKDVSQIGGF